MGEVTHQQVDLMLKLYEIRREPVLREARTWYVANFRPSSAEDVARIAPPGSKENAFQRQVVSYWDMAANIVNRGLIDEEFFLETSGEQWVVWERIRPVIAAMRAAYKNPHLFENLEKHVQHFEAWRERRSPGMSEAVRKMMTAAPAKAKGAKKK